jgi:hypothetical protein
VKEDDAGSSQENRVTVRLEKENKEATGDGRECARVAIALGTDSGYQAVGVLLDENNEGWQY